MPNSPKKATAFRHYEKFWLICENLLAIAQNGQILTKSNTYAFTIKDDNEKVNSKIQ